MELQDFVGKTVSEVQINQACDVMLWFIDDKVFTLIAVGDCCSSSWYEHCDNASAFDNAQIFECENVNVESIETESETIQINMFKIKTSKGDCTIEFRNSSNGYYSGWIEIHEGKPKSGSFEKIEDF